MHRSIHLQLLIPFLLLQLCTVFLVIIATGYIAVQQVKEQEEEHVQQVITTLEAAHYPLTPKILEQLKSLTGAEFVLLNAENQIQSSTFPNEIQINDSITKNLKQLTASFQIIKTTQGNEYLAGYYQSSPVQGNFNIVVLYPQKLWSATLRRLITPYILLGIIFTLMTWLATSLIASRFSQRLQRLKNHVNELSQLKFSELSAEPFQDEIHFLSLGINKMSQLLDQAFRQTQQQERMRILSQLVGGIAHQLRNSLTGVRLALQLHQKSCTSVDQETLEKGLQQLRFIEEEIKTLLRVSKGSELLQIPGSLKIVIQESVQLLKPYCQHQQIDFQIQLSNHELELLDTEGFRGALMNLLINATEAAGPQGKVALSDQIDEEHYHLYIKDNGPGIPEEIKDQIFEPFFTTKPEGAGLGLALAKQAVHDNGGEITCYREEGWTVFKITF